MAMQSTGYYTRAYSAHVKAHMSRAALMELGEEARVRAQFNAKADALAKMAARDRHPVMPPSEVQELEGTLKF